MSWTAFLHTLHTATAAADLPRFELTPSTITALVCVFLVSTLAPAAGVGGGAFFVPLFIVTLQLGLKDATVMSQACIAAVSAASIAFNVGKRLPTDPDTTLIAFPLLLTMTPSILAGVCVGVLLNQASPAWLITAMLVALLLFMSWRTAQKGLVQYHGETAAKREAAAAAAAAAGAAAAQQPSSSSSPDDLAGDPAAVIVSSPAAAAEAPGKPPRRRAPYPWSKLLCTALLFAVFGALQLLRQDAPRCSPRFFAVLAAQVLLGLGCSALCAHVFLVRPAREAEARDSLAAPLLASSSTSSLTGLLARRAHRQQASMGLLMLNSLKVAAAGAVAGLVGVGGGLMMAPLLLDAGVPPQSTSATSNCLVFASSSAAALAFYLDGRLPLEHAAVFCSVAAAASLAGLTGVGRLVKASGRPSLVVLLLAFIMVAGGVCSAVFGFLDAWQHGGDQGFKPIC